MKKLLFIGVLGLAACGGGLQQDTPEATAKGFLQALNDADFETAKGYVVKTSHQYVLELEAQYNMSSAEERKTLFAKADQLRCQEEKGRMVCNACCNGHGDAATLPMMENNKRWFIDLDL